jgi:hypothetical protein
MTWVLEYSSAELGARLALLSIANHADRQGHNAYPSYATIGIEARMSRRGAIDAIERLERDGHISIKRKASPYRTNIYTIVGMASEVSSPTFVTDGEADGEDDDTLMVKLASPEQRTKRLNSTFVPPKGGTPQKEGLERVRQMTAALAEKKSL